MRSKVLMIVMGSSICLGVITLANATQQTTISSYKPTNTAGDSHLPVALITQQTLSNKMNTETNLSDCQKSDKPCQIISLSDYNTI